MRLREAILRERREHVEQILRRPLPVAFLGRAADEPLALLGHLRGLFLAHGAAQDVGLPERVSGHDLGDLHHLFLVDDDAVGLLEHRLQLRQRVLHRPAARLGLDELVDELHRSGTIQRGQGHQVLNPLRPGAGQQAAHAGTLELKHAGGLALAEHPVGVRVVLRHRREVERGAVAGRLPGANQPHRILDHGKGLEAEEVHLHQAAALQNVFAGVLGGDCAAARIAVQRYVVGKRIAPDHDARGVRGGVPRQSLQLEADIEQIGVAAAALAHGAQPRLLFDRGLQVALRAARYQLGHGVRLRVGDVQHARHVADHRARLERPEGDDLGHAVAAILLGHVRNHLAAPLVAEVDVEIGHRHPFRIEEPLEHQTVRERFDIGDAQRVGDQRRRPRAAPRPHRQLAAPRERDEVPYDQEIAGVAHGFDHAEFVIEARAQLRRHRCVALGQTDRGDVAQIRLLGVAVGHLVLREQRSRTGNLELAALGHLEGVAHRLRHAVEQAQHVGLVLEVELLAVEAQAVGVGQALAGADTDQHVLGARVVAAGVVHVVGGHQRNLGAARHFDERPVDGCLFPQPVILQLQVEVARPEQIAIADRQIGGLRDALVPDQRRNLGRQAAGKSDQAVGVAGEHLLVNPRPVVEPLGVADGGELHQIAIAGLVAGQQAHVIAARRAFAVVAAVTGAAVVPRARAQVALRTDQRRYAARPARIVKGDGAEHRAVVGERQVSHAAGHRLVDQGVDRCRPVKQRVVGMDVQMNELGHALPAAP